MRRRHLRTARGLPRRKRRRELRVFKLWEVGGVLGFAGGVLMPFLWAWIGGGKREAKAALREIIVLLTVIFTLV